MAVINKAIGVFFNRSEKNPNLEIERKFLVLPEFRNSIYKTDLVRQGYLSDDPARTVRVRTIGKKAYLTIKGIGSASGASRFEFETRIPFASAMQLFKLCLPGAIVKRRHLVRVAKHVFEVDEFLGDNEGLVIAEIELTTEDEAFEKPSWLSTEVTGDQRYYNSAMAKNPYINWPKEDPVVVARWSGYTR